MTTLIATFITWALTGLLKNVAVDKYADNRALFVRLLAAFFALISAFAIALLDHQMVSVGVISVFVDALVAWLAAIGVYHAASPSTK